MKKMIMKKDNKCSVCGDEYGRELRADKTGPIKATYKSGETIEFVSRVRKHDVKHEI